MEKYIDECDDTIYEIRNYRIDSTHLGHDDYRMSLMLHLNSNGSCQGYGGYGMNVPTLCTIIESILDTVGVDTWEKLVGEYVRVRRLKTNSYEIHSIGHLVEDKWCVLKELYAPYRKD